MGIDARGAARTCRWRTRHPGTAGKELAVVLADPVRYATELNALRLRRHALALSEIEKPEDAHPLNSSNALLGLKESVLV